MRRVKDNDTVIQVVGDPEVPGGIKREVSEIGGHAGIAHVSPRGVVADGGERRARVWRGRARVFEYAVIQKTAFSRVQLASGIKGHTHIVAAVQAKDEALRHG